jgi:hypothetical protein
VVHTPNSPDNFWHHVNQSGGPDSCWPWLGKLDAQGRARYHFDNKTKDTHQIAYFIQHAVWLKRYDIAHCPALRTCCNPAHLKRRDINHQRFADNIMGQQGRLRLFTRFLMAAYPELIWLDKLLGDQLPAFIGKYDGQIISLRIPGVVNGLEAKTIAIQVPAQAELMDIARVLDCHFTLASVQARDRAGTSRKLQLKYACPAQAITRYSETGALIVKALNQDAYK